MIRAKFLGGADEIGASSTWLEFGERRVLVDFGLRHKARNEQVHPVFAQVEEAGRPDALVLTHAHLDHSGALPLAHLKWPDIPIFMTPATLRLIALLLADSVKIMSLESARTGAVPLFGLEAVESLLSSVTPVGLEEPVEVAPGVQLEFHNAGHILGAAMAVFRSERGSLAMSGDFATTPQHTIPGCTSAGLDVDVFVTESTYGGRHHAPRANEEQRLLEQVGAVLARGGNVLFPAFAIGRSQELLLILSRGIQQGVLPEVPVYVDGLVRHVCGLYSHGLAPLSPWLTRRVEQAHPFWPEDGPVQPIWDVRARQELAMAAGPKVFVSSSGMLTGGPSALYARLFAAQTESFIAITGYQDEESPGRAVQDLARQGGGLLRLPDGPVQLRCKVGTYGLSAHADEGQVVDVAGQSGASQVVLVHGDKGARAALSDALGQRYGDAVTVWRPGLHEELLLHTAPRSWSAVAPSPETRVSLQDVLALAHMDLPTPALLSELARALGWRGRQLMPHALQDLEAALLADGSPWRRKKGRFNLSKTPDGTLLLRGEAKRAKAKPKVKKPDVDQNTVMTLLGSLWDDDCTPYRVSAYPGQLKMRLRWHFPHLVSDRYDEALQDISARTGWHIEHHDQVHHQKLLEVVGEVLPPHWTLAKAPSLHLDERRVVATIALEQLEDWAVNEAQELLLEKTGFQLELKPILPAPQPSPASSKGVPAFVVRPSQPDTPKMVQNLAVSRAKNTLQPLLGAKPKLAVQGDTLVIAFVTPQLGQRHTHTLQQLADLTGWALGARATPDQNALLEIARLYTHGWALRKPKLSIHADEQLLVATVSEPPPSNVEDAAKQQVLRRTGWSLQVRIKPLA